MNEATGDASALLGLDHVVLAVPSLEQAVADFRALGFTVTPGGRHPGRSSHNALVVFADGAYIELIAWTAPAPEERWWRTLQASGAGWVDYALLPRDTTAALQAAQARGLQTMSGPLDGGRVRPDGIALRWQSARQTTPELPFLCGDITPRDLRVPTGAARQHANGALGIAGLEVAVPALEAALQRYGALLGPQAPLDVEPAPAAGIAAARCTLGGCSIRLLAPRGGAAGADNAADASGAEPTPAAQALRQRLGSRGPGPLRLLLQGAPGAPVAPASAWPLAQTQGAAIAWA